MFKPKKLSAGAPSELQIALDNRAFEIQLFWQRSNYFLVLMTALGVGAFSVKDVLLSPLIAFFATLCSYFWFRTNLGSKFWQESWEVEVSELAKEAGIRSFERPMSDVKRQVRESFAAGEADGSMSRLRKWINRRTLDKYSVTYNMILLSLSATFVWAAVTFTFMWRLVEAICDQIDYCFC